MKVIVTGATGYVGSAITRRLRDRGETVFSVCRTGEIAVDLCSPHFVATVQKAVPTADAIVHCAACLHGDATNTQLSSVNAIGTQQVLRLAQSLGVHYLINLSSVPLIGRPQSLPVDESHPAVPATPYHASKFYAENLVRLSHGPQLKTTNLRLTSPIGAGAPPGRIFSTFAGAAAAGAPITLLGRGGRRQNYVDIRDIAQAVERCLAESATGLFLIGGERSYSNRELAEHCCRVAGSNAGILYSDQPDSEEDLVWEISTARAHATFGYTPAFSLNDSIRAFLASL